MYYKQIARCSTHFVLILDTINALYLGSIVSRSVTVTYFKDSLGAFQTGIKKASFVYFMTLCQKGDYDERQEGYLFHFHFRFHFKPVVTIQSLTIFISISCPFLFLWIPSYIHDQQAKSYHILVI